MNTPAADNRRELDRLIDRMCDQLATADELDALGRLLLEDPEARCHYVASLELHARLAWQMAPGKAFAPHELLRFAAGDDGPEVGVPGSGNLGLGASVPSGQQVASDARRVSSDGVDDQWPVASGRRVQSRESRVESSVKYPESLDSRIPNPEIPEINLQSSKYPNLQIPTRHSPLTTLHYWAISYSVATVLLAVALLGAWSYTITHPAPDSLATRNSRGGTPSGTNEKEPSQFTFVGRVSGMVNCQWADDATATSPGAAVALNRRYVLKSGLMEISYDSGAKVILQGPCEYKVESSRGGFLKVGKLVARVGAGGGGRGAGEATNLPSPFGRGAGGEGFGPHSQPALTLALSQGERGLAAHPSSPIPHPSSLIPHPSPLFSVRTPTALVTDLGTEFGVEVSATGETASHVFQGQVRVKVEGAWGEGRGAGDKNPESPNPRIPNPEVILSAGQSVRVERDGDKSPRIVRKDGVSAAAGFIQHLPRRVPIELFNTGIGLREGDPDPHWQLVARSDQPDFKACPAVVTRVNPNFISNDPRRSQWISAVPDMSNLPDQTTYTFRTLFRLDAAGANSAVLRGRFMADNRIDAIRLNGRRLDLPSYDYGAAYDRAYWVDFHADRGFVEGTNVLEIDVYNGDEQLLPETPMAVRVELEGTALKSQANQALEIKSTSAEKRR